MSLGAQAGTRERALALLGVGQPPGVVASALGVDHSRIAQLLAEPEFAKEVAERRFANLQDAAFRDKKWDAIEDLLLEKLKDVLEYIVKPQELLRALAVVNNAKRRGMIDPTTGGTFAPTVKLVLPGVTKAKFQVDATGVIISVGERSMTTMPANILMKELDGEYSACDQDGRQQGPQMYESGSDNGGAGESETSRRGSVSAGALPAPSSLESPTSPAVSERSAKMKVAVTAELERLGI